MARSSARGCLLRNAHNLKMGRLPFKPENWPDIGNRRQIVRDEIGQCGRGRPFPCFVTADGLKHRHRPFKRGDLPGIPFFDLLIFFGGIHAPQPDQRGINISALGREEVCKVFQNGGGHWALLRQGERAVPLPRVRQGSTYR